MTTQRTVHDAIEPILMERLITFIKEKPTSDVCLRIYNEIFITLTDIFQRANLKLTNEAANYFAQQYYDAIMINGGQPLDPNIFTQRAKLENIQTKELALMVMMMRGTDFSLPIIAEIKKRS